MLAHFACLALPQFTRRDVSFGRFFSVADSFFRFRELTIFLLRRPEPPLRLATVPDQSAVWGADAIPVFHDELKGLWSEPVAHF
jgi:hypothetical protein